MTHDPDSPTQSPAHRPLVRLDAVTKSYLEGERRRTVLDAADLTIEAGETVVLLGRSGSGKSTLLNLLSGIDLPDAGSVSIDGVDLGGLDERRRTLLRRHQVGFVFQFFNLIPTLTVEENLLLPLELAGRLAPDDRQRALAMLERMGLADRRGSYPDVLSGGEQQRVAIARALAHDPILLLADEPTGNLDLETAETVLEVLASELGAAGDRARTLVLATHSPEVARRLADRILRIEGGHLVEVADLLGTNPAEPEPA